MDRDERAGERRRLHRLDAERGVAGTSEVAPGRRTLAEQLAAQPASHAAHGIELALDRARTSLVAIERACDEIDHGAVMQHLTTWSSEIGSARVHLEHLPARDAQPRAGELAQLESRAAPILAQVPTHTRAAMDAGFIGDWTAWDREVASWRTATIQRKATSDRRPVDPQAIAAAGLSGAAATLPHAAQIQRSFGRHDVSSIRVQVGGAARVAALQLGATAFASGERIAFAETPDLHTAAHEAAHVIQQRAGVVAPGGLGREGDDHERAADAVADAVVAGRSAEALLDLYGVSTSRAAMGVVQRRTYVHEQKSYREIGANVAEHWQGEAWQYVEHNADLLFADIMTRLGSVVPPADTRLTWKPGGVGARFRAALEAALPQRDPITHLDELLRPGNAWFLVDQNRRLESDTTGRGLDDPHPVGSFAWAPMVGEVIGFEVKARVLESLARVVPRYVAQADAKTPAVVQVGDLVTSHPMDLVVARLLCDPDVVTAAPVKHAAGSPAAGLFPDGVRMLEDWRWLGDKSPSLWNWIEVRSPHDATPEDVAATLWLDPSKSYLASEVVAAPPYFRVEPGRARIFDDAKKYAPSGLFAKHDDNALALAGSPIATEVAIAQAAPEVVHDKAGTAIAQDRSRLADVLSCSSRQLDRASDALASWNLWELLLPARDWVTMYQAHWIAQPLESLPALASVIDGQQAILFEAVGRIVEIAGSAGPAARVERDDGPFRSALRAYAIAAGESHLIKSARAQLVVATAARDAITLTTLDQLMRDDRMAVDSWVSHGRGLQEDEASHSYEQYAVQLRELHDRKAAGMKLDAGEVALLSARVRGQAVDARARSLQAQLSGLMEAMSDAYGGPAEAIAALFGDNPHAYRLSFGDISARLESEVVIKRHALEKENVEALKGSTDAHQIAAAVNDSAHIATEQFTKIVTEEKLDAIVTDALKVLHNQEIRTRVVQIAILIGVSIIGMGAGSMVAGVVRGALLADASIASAGFIESAGVIDVAATAAGMLTDTAINTAGQVAVMGSDGVDSFVGNLATNLVARGALAPLQRVAAKWTIAERCLEDMGALRSVGYLNYKAFRFGVLLTAETVASMAVSHAVDSLRHSGEPPDEDRATNLLIEGASLAVGAMVHRRFGELDARLSGLAEKGVYLQRRARSLRAEAEKLAKVADKDAAMELAIKYYEALVEERKILTDLTPQEKLTAATIETLRAGNHAELAGMQDQQFALMHMRMAGLTPDDASNRTWAGSSEDIAIALYQAHRAGFEVKVEAHDMQARKWDVVLGDQALTILETKLQGRPRDPKAPLTEADRVHARRYADATRFLNNEWIAEQKRQIDGERVIKFDHIQFGTGLAGTMNQATLPAGGRNVIVALGDGALGQRGSQYLGQEPSAWDAPGIRGSEQAAAGDELMPSDGHGRSLDVGRFETQTRIYRGAGGAIEVRPAELTADWEAPDCKFRVVVTDTLGTARRFYGKATDLTVGPGPANLESVNTWASAEQVSSMLASGQILAGEDPDFSAKIRGGRTFVSGLSPTGAWAMEAIAASNPDSQVVGMGDTRVPTDWPALLAEYQGVLEEIGRIADGPVPAALSVRKGQIEEAIEKAQSGKSLRRNRRPGAAFAGDNPRLTFEFGSATRVKPLPDGRVSVTTKSGTNEQTQIFDQVVFCHGQDFGAPGGPGRMLGRGASPTGPEVLDLGDAPAGTIVLTPIYDASMPIDRADVLGLQGVDYPEIRLLGASGATTKALPWILPSERERYFKAVRRMSAKDAPTRDYGPITEDSHTVSGGTEVQRDKLPRANEVLAAKTYRLAGPESHLELDQAHPELWDAKVRDYFTVNLRANSRAVVVERLGGGRSKAIVYQVTIGGNDVGVFKLFNRNRAANEQTVLKMLDSANLTIIKAVHERGIMSIDGNTDYQSAALMDMAKGKSVKQLLDAVPAGEGRSDHLATLKNAVVKVALGLAEMHRTFAGDGLMTEAAKRDDANYMLKRSFRAGGDDLEIVRAALGADFEDVRAQLEGPYLDAFIAARVPATAYHGDANAGNFIIDGTGANAQVGMIDVEAMIWSVDPQGKGTKTGAADVGRFLESLESFAPGKLSATELSNLRNSFMTTYRDNLGVALDSTFAAAEAWYRAELEVAVLKSDPSAKPRLLRILGLGGAR